MLFEKKGPKKAVKKQKKGLYPVLYVMERSEERRVGKECDGVC